MEVNVYFYRVFGFNTPMNFFERLFGSGPKDSAPPDIHFGRYTDAYKTPGQQMAWNQSLELFDRGEILPAYRAFFSYLRDEAADNLTWTENGTAITFEFWQGSQRVQGFVDDRKVRVESRIARAEDLNVGFLRRLMEYNYALRFCRFALTPDNHLVLLFDSLLTDASPLKLLFAMRELAIHADKQDDLLLDEFRVLKPAEKRQFAELPETEKEVKYHYLAQEIQAVFAEMDGNNPPLSKFPGGFAYLLLALAFKLDYLVRPEGFTMDVLERIHGLYFSQEDKKPIVKVEALRKEFQKILDRPKATLFNELYRTRSTFGINNPVPHERIAALIESELPNMEWHLQHHHQALALAIPQYIAGYALFHFAPPQPDRDLFHLYFQITEPTFFRKLGFDIPFLDPNGKPDRRQILQAVRDIAERNRAQYPRLRPDVDRLNFDSPALFSKSYMLLIKELNLSAAS